MNNHKPYLGLLIPTGLIQIIIGLSLFNMDSLIGGLLILSGIITIGIAILKMRDK